MKTYFSRLAGGLPRGNKVYRQIKALMGALAAIGILLAAPTAPAQSSPSSREFNKPGNILIADQFNNRVIEVTPAGNIVWSFGRGPNDSGH